MRIDQIIIKPVLTEKATNLVKNKVYTFEVNPKANKFQIAESLEKLYQIKVGAVRVARRAGKVRKTGRKMIPKKTVPRKIAYIQVKEGKIDLFPQA